MRNQWKFPSAKISSLKLHVSSVTLVIVLWSPLTFYFIPLCREENKWKSSICDNLGTYLIKTLRVLKIWEVVSTEKIWEFLVHRIFVPRGILLSNPSYSNSWYNCSWEMSKHARYTPRTLFAWLFWLFQRKSFN